MIFFPNCKINIGLFVTSKREDAYHNIESVFYPLSLCDCLEMRKTDNTKTEFFLSGLGADVNYVAKDKNNSVLKAFYLLRSNFPKITNAKIYLHKNIPTFAGLGGGSADGTFALKLTDFMFDLRLSDEQLYYYASKLGSDNFFFLENRPMFVYGRGDKTEDVNISLKDYYIVLIKPDINIQTKEAYKNVHLTPKPFNLRNLDVKDIRNWKDYVRNDFELSLFEQYPLLAQIKQMLYDNGALYAQMSGSGATVFGIFDKELNLEGLNIDKTFFVHQEKLK